LGGSADLIESFVRARLDACGGFVDRTAKPDLYYTVFGIDCLLALGAGVPVDRITRYLGTFDTGQTLNLLHLTCLARCFAALPGVAVPDGLRQRVAEALQRHRKEDGGYDTELESSHGSAYGCFVAVAALQDIDAPLPEADAIDHCLNGLATADGGYANDPDIPLGSVPATSAAVTLRRALGLTVSPRSVRFLTNCFHAQGGMIALPAAPLPDLLSTAVGLHALRAADANVSELRERCLDFLDSLWTARGSFYPTWAEEDHALDVEYTFYALLALGHLSV